MLPEGVRLIHIRHGQTDWNVEGRLQGQLDIPLNDTGRGQAARNGRVLAERLAADGVDPASLAYIASPLGRAMETMRLVRDALGLDHSFPTDPRLMEITFGEWTGKTYAELRASGYETQVRARKKDKWSFRPPGAETYAELAQRVAGWLETVERDTIAVAHGGIFRVLNGLLLGMPWHEVPSVEPPQDRIAIFSGGQLELV